MNDRNRFYIPVLSALVLMGAVLTLRALTDLPDDWKSYICKPEDCTVQAWLAASAGLLGFAAAAVGAVFIFGQLSEQRKQTAFLLGDSHPTVEVLFQAGRKKSAAIRFTNWNRRLVVIQRVWFEGEKELPMPSHLRQLVKDGEEQFSTQLERDGSVLQFPAVDGWSNRQGPPAHFDFALFFERDEPLKVSDPANNEPVALWVEYFIPTERGKMLTLSIAGLAADLLPRKGAIWD